jgi:hypothetical protein
MQQPVTATQLKTTERSESEEGLRALVVASGLRFSWLTLERAVYIGLALLALALRLANLGAHPLSGAEAEQTLAAWHIYQGDPVAPAGYSPLVATLNALSFFLLGGSAFAARLGPALLGVALVLLPYGLRRHLGREGALAAAALFAISPTAAYFSRSVNGDIGAAVGGLALAVGLFNWLDSLQESQDSPRPSPVRSPLPDPPPSRGRQESQDSPRPSPISNLCLAAAGLVLLLTASPAAYSILVLLLGFLLLAVAVGDKGYAVSAQEGLAALRQRLMGWGNFGLALLVGFLSVATAFLFNMGGLTAAADLLTTWFLSFVPSALKPGAYPAVFLLTLYEPLILLAGLTGLAASLLRRRLIDLFLVWWFFGGIALNLLRSGRTNGAVLVPLIPLILLAGFALGKLWRSLREEGSWQKEGLLAVIGIIIGGYAYISLMTYTLSGGKALWLPVAAVGLFLGLVALFWVWYEADSALRGTVLVAIILLGVFTINIGSRLNYTFAGVGGGGEPVSSPYQPLIQAPAGEGIGDLMSTLKRISSWRAGDAYLLPIVADRRVGPVVEWQLRDFKNVTWVDSVEAWASTTPPNTLSGIGDMPAILAPAPIQLSLEESYAGQDFAVRAFWSPAGLSGQALIRWIFLRVADTPVSYERVVLWVHTPQAAPEESQSGISGESLR